ncbi:MAG: alpha-L-arabinofuranosidase C-terminal domain-containing protein [Planctomycetota bacterium]
MERVTYCLGGAALASLLIGLSGCEPEKSPSIYVNARKVIGKVNPWVFGNNMLGYQKSAWQHANPDYASRGAGIWDPEKRRSVPEMAAMAKNSGLSVARYPGGCGAHLFDWKKCVGPLAQRPDQQFGLPEFLQNCADISAEPLITLADYFGAAQDAVDLVQYLNSPNDGKSRWAALRASDGHPAPWNVVWFEYGNETEHGDHHGQKMTAQEYARRYLEYRRAMKAVDPRVKLGAVIATGFPNLNQWARAVLEIIGKDVDFVIHHSYKPGYSGNDGKPDGKTLLTMGLAEADQIQDYYDEMNALLRELTDRRDVPIAVTEFNGHFVQEKPTPYRHCLGNALINAEMLRVFMRPQNNIVMANFWQFCNEYWGAVKGYTYKNEPLVKRPQYYPFEMYHNHFGEELLEARALCDKYETDGGFGVAPAKGQGSKFKLFPEVAPLSQPWQISEIKGVAQRTEGDTLIVDFQAGEDVNYFHTRKRLAAEPDTGYRLTGWIKTEGITSSRGASLQVGDARGWTETKSAVNSQDITGTQDWTKVEVDYAALPDAKEIDITARRIGGVGPIKGRAFFRDLRVQKFTPKRFPAVPYLSVNASRSADGKKFYLMVVNKNPDAAIIAPVFFDGFSPRRAKSWTLTGPAIDATNEKDPNTVTVKERDLGEVQNGFSIEFSPSSLTAIEAQ